VTQGKATIRFEIPITQETKRLFPPGVDNGRENPCVFQDMAYKDSRKRRWVPRGGSNPSGLERRLRDALKNVEVAGNVKIFTADEIAEYEKELKQRDKRTSQA
jgi:hypothetical protein